MHWKQGLFVGTILILAAAGCSKKGNSEKAAAPQAESMKQKASEAMGAAQESANAEKEGFVKTMQAHLDQFQQNMKDLASKAEAKGDQKMAQAKEELDKAKNAGSDAWEGAKNAAQAAYDQLEKTYKEIAAKYQ